MSQFRLRRNSQLVSPQHKSYLSAMMTHVVMATTLERIFYINDLHQTRDGKEKDDLFFVLTVIMEARAEIRDKILTRNRFRLIR